MVENLQFTTTHCHRPTENYSRSTTTTTSTTSTITTLCLGLPGWASTRRNIHPLTPILIINHPLSTSSIYYNTETVKNDHRKHQIRNTMKHTDRETNKLISIQICAHSENIHLWQNILFTRNMKSKNGQGNVQKPETADCDNNNSKWACMPNITCTKVESKLKYNCYSFWHDMWLIY